MVHYTPLFEEHTRCGGQVIDFHDWMLPVNYGSQLKEHEFVRQDAGMFDVSHMHIVDIKGPEAERFLRYLLANDVRKLKTPGRALYTCLLREDGGILDDLIVYRRVEGYRLVLNAGTRQKDWVWLLDKSENFQVEITARDDLAIIALQGPRVREKLRALLPEAAWSLTFFHFLEFEDSLLACTGYTGEDGYEWILPAERAGEIWRRCLALGFHPCGLGARDTLRLEAGLNLYGQDMTEEVNPLESNLAWTISWTDKERDFIGRAALLSASKSGIKRALVGLVLKDKGVLRQGQEVYEGETCLGMVTSGSFSPSLQSGIAMARVTVGSTLPLVVVVRGRRLPVELVALPFVKREKR